MYELSDDPERVDRDAIWNFMSEQAPWGRWRSRGQLDRQLDEAWRVVGAYKNGELVGFARAVSDGVSLAYLADVYVLPEHRGHGLGAGLVKLMIDDGPGAHFRWMLHTSEAHGLYGKFGFRPPDNTYLERKGGAPRVPHAREQADSLEPS